MKIVAVILIVGGLSITMRKSPILAFIYIVLGVFLLKKYKHQAWLPKINKSKNQQKKELEKLEELKTRQATRKFNVSGVTYENRQQLLDIIAAKYGAEGVDRIDFIPEPDNPYDPNAIKIFFENIGHIGYIPKERTIEIGKLLNKNTYDIKWDIDCFFDEDEGVNYMEIRLYKQN